MPADIKSLLIYRYRYQNSEVIDLSKPYREVTDRATIQAAYECITGMKTIETPHIQFGGDLVILIRNTSGKILHVARSGSGLKYSLLSPMYFTQNLGAVTLGAPHDAGGWIEVKGDWLAQLQKESHAEIP